MTTEELEKMVRHGETSRVQFKQRFTTPKQMAEEMVAFANCEGGVILFGIEDKTGEIIGLDYEDIQKTTRELGNTANEHVRPTIYIRTDVVELEGGWCLWRRCLWRRCFGGGTNLIRICREAFG